MLTRKTTIGVLTAALLVTALPASMLAQDDGEGALSPEGVNWSLTEIGGDDGFEVPAEVEANLFMAAGEANGNTGCNAFSGTYTLDGESLVFDENVAVTMAFCEGAAGEVEQAYLAALPTVAGWGVDGDELSLLDDAQAVALVYEAQSPAIDVTEADIETLVAELERLHLRINNTRQDMRQLNVDSLRERVVANEAVLAEVTERFINVRSRVRVLEERIAVVEEALGLVAESEE